MKKARKTEKKILQILHVLKEAKKSGERYLTINQIAKRTGIHKWSVSRIIDLYMPYVDVKVINELEMLGMKVKLVNLPRSIDEKQALAYFKMKKSNKIS